MEWEYSSEDGNNDDQIIDNRMDSSPEKDGEVGKVSFARTIQHFEALARFLVCVKCEKLPQDGKVWTLGCCQHKYCQACVKALSGKKCICCQKSGYPKDAKQDFFFSSILSKIPSVYLAMRRLQNFRLEEETANEKQDEMLITNSLEGKEKKNEEFEVQEPKNVGESNETGNCYELNKEAEVMLVESTPKDNRPEVVSQEFPEVLEETPQHKAKGPVVSSRKSNQHVLPRVLAFPSQEAGKKDNEEVEKTRTVSPAKDDHSDEELFPSQPNDGGDQRPAELPILTPYQNASKVPNNHVFDGQKSSEKNKAGRASDGRKSGEQGPPPLTPHRSDARKDDNAQKTRRGRKGSLSSTNSGDTRASRRSTRNRNDPPKQKDESKLANKAGTPDYSPKVMLEDINKKKSLPTPNRKRRISAVSVSSCTSAGRSVQSKEKRNAKGETPLLVSCRVGNLEKVKALVEDGADVNAKDNAGWTPVHEVISGKGSPSDKADILRILCEKDADLNELGGIEEVTPLHTAAESGLKALVEVLLEFRASPNIRNGDGKLPIDITSDDEIKKLLSAKMSSVSVPSPMPGGNVNLNNSTFLSTSIVEEDPAVMKVMRQKAIVYFNYDVRSDVVKDTVEKLELKVSKMLTPEVTHIVYEVTDPSSDIPLSVEYLYALAHCMWQVSCNWITDSLKSKECVIPTSYELVGHQQSDKNSSEVNDMAPGLSRMNRENGNPGLFSGFTFYLYKTCSFTSSGVRLNKEQLKELIVGAGGTVTNRDLDPQAIDPLEAPPRFHVSNKTGGNDSSEKLTLTTHIILYDVKSPPPPSKRYNMEHVKTLKSDWLIDGLLNFRLQNPDNYL